jgi:putative ABC transport system permease protein
MTKIRRFVMRLLSHARSGRAERELSREIRAHLRLLEDRFVEQGMSPGDARYEARRAFGGVEQAKERQRDARSFRWLTGWSMDLKLGARMLVRYPGLTIVGVIALAVAIGAGAAYMEFALQLLRPPLPFAGGDRVVGIVNWDAATARPNRRSLRDFTHWRRELRSVVDLGATYSLPRNLITEDGRAEPVRAAEISASAFRITGTPPLIGRTLVDDDERADTPPVGVIGEDLWRARLGADPAVLGRTIRLGRSAYTVVGIMPRSFGFPMNHTLWVPLRERGDRYQPGEGPQIMIFGRLAPGVSLATAQAELTTIADREAAAAPAGAPRLRPAIKPYIASMWSTSEDGALQRIILYTANVLFLALVGICGANVATLVFARTITREAEITLRAALGASRARIVSQLFAEALVLSSVAAVAGLAIAWTAANWAKARFVEAQRPTPPFWWHDGLSTGTLLYAAVLAILAAVVVGVTPALKATGSRMQARLKTAGGAAPGMRFGGAWTAVVVGQVALTIIFLMAVVSAAWNARVSPYAPGNFAFRPADYITVRLEMDTDTASPDGGFAARYKAAFLELERRLELDPSVAGVTHTTRLPGSGSEFIVDMDTALPARGVDDPLWVREAFVGVDFFETFDAPIVSGRGLTMADAELARGVAVVDQTFVSKVLGGRDPVGLRIRRRGNPNPSTPWLEIVGVVKDLGIRPQKTSEDAMLYRPAAAGAAEGRVHVVVRARGEASTLATTVRRIAAEGDPTLRLYDVMPLADYYQDDRIAAEFMARAMAIVSAVALLLSTAGVYALVSFTLSRRTREIGIRAALGAAPRRIVAAIFSRAFAQIGLGILAGSVPGYLLVAKGAPEMARGGGALVAAGASAAVGAFIVVVTGLACAIPARRALRINPTDALRAE